MKKIFIVLCFNLLCCNSVFANSGFYNSKISARNVLVIELKSPVATGEGCAVSNAVVLQKNHYMFKEMYAALLSAFHAQTVISGWANGCFREYPVLTRLDLRK
ncbi:hypothetical protein [Acinetobacter bereziniae]|uniref:hypothetical protein n=1 Tax=Acinetobacter bereziniae TaxID=106648 RepID=UPI003009C901